jgi:hypothetical protein
MAAAVPALTSMRITDDDGLAGHGWTVACELRRPIVFVPDGGADVLEAGCFEVHAPEMGGLEVREDQHLAPREPRRDPDAHIVGQMVEAEVARLADLSSPGPSNATTTMVRTSPRLKRPRPSANTRGVSPE